jgi:hypothetical protein
MHQKKRARAGGQAEGDQQPDQVCGFCRGFVAPPGLSQSCVGFSPSVSSSQRKGTTLPLRITVGQTV